MFIDYLGISDNVYTLITLTSQSFQVHFLTLVTLPLPQQKEDKESKEGNIPISIAHILTGVWPNSQWPAP